MVGIDLADEPVPDETTVCKFRHLLKRNDLGVHLLESVARHLQASYLRQVENGVRIDARQRELLLQRHAIGHERSSQQQPTRFACCSDHPCHLISSSQPLLKQMRGTP